MRGKKGEADEGRFRGGIGMREKKGDTYQGSGKGEGAWDRIGER